MLIGNKKVTLAIHLPVSLGQFSILDFLDEVDLQHSLTV